MNGLMGEENQRIIFGFKMN